MNFIRQIEVETNSMLGQTSNLTRPTKSEDWKRYLGDCKKTLTSISSRVTILTLYTAFCLTIVTCYLARHLLYDNILLFSQPQLASII